MFIFKKARRLQSQKFGSGSGYGNPDPENWTESGSPPLHFLLTYAWKMNFSHALSSDIELRSKTIGQCFLQKLS